MVSLTLSLVLQLTLQLLASRGAIRMAKVKLNLKGLSTTEKIAKGRQIVAALTGNPNFPTPQPALSVVSAALDELEASNADLQTSRQSTTAKTSFNHQKEDAVEGILRQLAGYVESVSRDDEPKILSAGMSVRSAATPTHVHEVPAALGVTEGDHEGQLDAHWDTVKSAKSYVIQQSTDPSNAASWVHVVVSTKSSATISGLVSGVRYWFRVAAVMSGGQSGWSDPASKIAS